MRMRWESAKRRGSGLVPQRFSCRNSMPEKELSWRSRIRTWFPTFSVTSTWHWVDAGKPLIRDYLRKILRLFTLDSRCVRIGNGVANLLPNSLGLDETRGAGSRRADPGWHVCVVGRGVTRKAVEAALASVAVMAVPRL
jgi:hypothetical protein